MPRRPSLSQMKEGLLSIFGIYRGVDYNRFVAPEPEQLPTVSSEEPKPKRLRVLAPEARRAL
jgi:hypothetical protein